MQKGDIPSPALADALMDIYVGADPPSPIAKNDFFGTLEAIVSTTAAPADKPAE